MNKEYLTYPQISEHSTVTDSAGVEHLQKKLAQAKEKKKFRLT